MSGSILNNSLKASNNEKCWTTMPKIRYFLKQLLYKLIIIIYVVFKSVWVLLREKDYGVINLRKISYLVWHWEQSKNCWKVRGKKT